MGNKNQKIRVSQKAILFDKNGRILTIKRTKTDLARPLYWDFPGGKLDFGEDTNDGIIREIKEETGLDIKDLSVIDVISGFNDRDEFWVTICYVARPITTEVKLSGEHNNFKWIDSDKFQQLKASPRNKKFVKRFKFLQSQK